ncbi:MAG: hypothetical protein HQ564_07880 [Candidatus Saganbacteria bacterium]|nr:hypothetical protein [Candidatus Saganbacteria bacterium]
MIKNKIISFSFDKAEGSDMLVSLDRMIISIMSGEKMTGEQLREFGIPIATVLIDRDIREEKITKTLIGMTHLFSMQDVMNLANETVEPERTEIAPQIFDSPRRGVERPSEPTMEEIREVRNREFGRGKNVLSSGEITSGPLKGVRTIEDLCEMYCEKDRNFSYFFPKRAKLFGKLAATALLSSAGILYLANKLVTVSILLHDLLGVLGAVSFVLLTPLFSFLFLYYRFTPARVEKEFIKTLSELTVEELCTIDLAMSFKLSHDWNNIFWELKEIAPGKVSAYKVRLRSLDYAFRTVYG